MTPAYVNFVFDKSGKILNLEILSPEKPLSVFQHLEILEYWIANMRAQREKEFKAYQELKNSGKIVSMTDWKRGDKHV